MNRPVGRDELTDAAADAAIEQACRILRLPTIRELMKRFGASQMLVQRAFQGLKDRGLIDSQVGRGTYFRGAGARPPTAAPAEGEQQRPRAASANTVQSSIKSVLLLRRSISIARGRVLVEGLQRRQTTIVALQQPVQLITDFTSRELS